MQKYIGFYAKYIGFRAKYIGFYANLYRILCKHIGIYAK